jgi:hypothetical protein
VYSSFFSFCSKQQTRYPPLAHFTYIPKLFKMSAPPAQAQNTHNNGPIDDKDVQEWSSRFNHTLGNLGEVINSKAPESAQDWTSGFFSCFNPLDLCLISCFLPCVTFGKTYHRMHKSASLEGYEPINTSVSPCKDRIMDHFPMTRGS